MAVNKDFLVKNGIQVGDNAVVTGSLTASGLAYPVSDGSIRQAIVTDGAGSLDFADVDTVESPVTNDTGSLIPKGAPVYQTGVAGNNLTIALSDASNPATMPAIGVAASDIANGASGYVIHFGPINGVDTSSFSEGDRIYVAAGGGYQSGRPTGEGNVVQFLGVVTKIHASNGSGVVFGGGRSMDVPNLDEGNIFIGQAGDTATTATLDTDLVPEGSNLYYTDTRAVDAVEAHPHLTIDGGTLYVDTDSNRIGINDTSPQEALDVNGNVNVQGGITSTGSNMLGYGTNLDQGIGRLSINYLGSGEPILASQGSSINFGSNLALYDTNTIFKTASNPNHLNIAQDRVGYDINFQTAPVTNGVRATAMTIEGTGNVGIGTASPEELLHVRNALGDTRIQIDSRGTSTGKTSIEFHNGGTGNPTGIIEVGGLASGSNGIVFKHGNNGAEVEHMRISSAGNVGIGTDNPDHKLHIVGDIGQSSSNPNTYGQFQRKIYDGTFDNSATIPLFTLTSNERPFCGTIYVTAYKSSEGVAGVWTAACIYPTVTPVVNQQSYVTRSNEAISVTWSVDANVPTLSVNFSGFSGTCYYTVMVEGIMNQTYGTVEGAL